MGIGDTVLIVLTPPARRDASRTRCKLLGLIAAPPELTVRPDTNLGTQYKLDRRQRPPTAAEPHLSPALADQPAASEPPPFQPPS